MLDMSDMVIDVHEAHVYKVKQWKTSTIKCNVFYVKVEVEKVLHLMKDKDAFLFIRITCIIYNQSRNIY